MATNADAKTMGIVAEIFAAFPNRFRFTSGKRTVAQNKVVGGVANSYHVTGQAADFVPVNGQFPTSEREAIGRIVSKYGYEVIVHDAGSGLHYHIEPAPRGTSSVAPVTPNTLPVVVTDQNSNTKTLVYIGLGILALSILRR